MVTPPVATGRAPRAPRAPRARPVVGGRGGQLARFATIGVVCTALNLGLFAVLHKPLGDQAANALSLVLATLVNTAANRAWTFGVRGRAGLGRHHAQSLLVFAVTWGLTSAALALLGLSWPEAPTLVRVGTVAAANVVATVVRFVVMRRWIFRTATA